MVLTRARIIIIIIIIADNKSFQRELTSPITSIKLNKNNIKSLVSCRAVKFSKEKSFQFLLESWSAGGWLSGCLWEGCSKLQDQQH